MMKCLGNFSQVKNKKRKKTLYRKTELKIELPCLMQGTRCRNLSVNVMANSLSANSIRLVPQGL